MTFLKRDEIGRPHRFKWPTWRKWRLLCLAIIIMVTMELVSFSRLLGGLPLLFSGNVDNNAIGFAAPAAAEEIKDNRTTLRAARYKYHAPQPRTAEDLLHATSICGDAPLYADYWKQNFKNRSSNGEDETIYTSLVLPFLSSLAGVYPPTYVELGAFNGMEESNTRFFDVCLGWEGALIEANPWVHPKDPHNGVYPKLVRNRPHSHRFNMAASCDDDGTGNQTLQFITHPFTNARQDTIEGASSYENDKNLHEVPCGSLTHVLFDAFPDGHVTFFSLDVEGAEPRVLKQMNFTALFVEIVIIENRNNFCQTVCKSRDEFQAIMREAGYHLMPGNLVTKSDLFVHPRSQFLNAPVFSNQISRFINKVKSVV